MPNWCVVNRCPNCSNKFDRIGRKLRFFRFPADKKIQEKWRSACRRNDVINVANARVCSEHFTNEDYEDELQARLMGLIPIRLKKTAVPTQFLSPVQKKSIKTIPEDIKTKQRKELVEKLLQAGEPDASEPVLLPSASCLAECVLEDCESEAELAPNADYSVETVIGEATSVDFQVTIATPEMLMQKIRELENENRELLQRVQKAEASERKRQITVDKLKALEKKNEVMSKRLQALIGASFSDIDKRVKVMLKDCLSPKSSLPLTPQTTDQPEISAANSDELNPEVSEDNKSNIKKGSKKSSLSLMSRTTDQPEIGAANSNGLNPEVIEDKKSNKKIGSKKSSSSLMSRSPDQPKTSATNSNRLNSEVIEDQKCSPKKRRLSSALTSQVSSLLPETNATNSDDAEVVKEENSSSRKGKRKLSTALTNSIQAKR